MMRVKVAYISTVINATDWGCITCVFPDQLIGVESYVTVAVTCITRWYNVLGVREVELCKLETL